MSPALDTVTTPDHRVGPLSIRLLSSQELEEGVQSGQATVDRRWTQPLPHLLIYEVVYILHADLVGLFVAHQPGEQR